MKKTYLKFIVIVVIAALFIYCLFLALDRKKEPSSASSITTTTQPVPSPALTVPAQNGSVQVKDFTKTPARVDGDTIVIDENSQFSIVYFSQSQTFLITLLSQPVQAARDAAEQDFLNKLQVDKVTACRLTVSLGVPSAVDESLAGQNYGLSFCPLGQPF